MADAWLAFRSAICRNKISTSVSLIAEVGSSMTMSWASRDIALTISMSCIEAMSCIPHGSASVVFETQPVEQRASVGLHLLEVDKARQQTSAERRFAAEKDVLGDAHFQNRAEFLVDHRNAAVQRSRDVRQFQLLAVEVDFALVDRIGAGEDLHQRRFSRPVLADENMHGGVANLQVHPIEREDAEGSAW